MNGKCCTGHEEALPCNFMKSTSAFVRLEGEKMMLYTSNAVSNRNKGTGNVSRQPTWAAAQG
jgi:hypothetical protein